MTREELEYIAATASRMQLLQKSEGWDEYRKQLAEAEQRHMERLVTSPPEEVAVRQGIVQGLREAAHLPDLLIEQYRRASDASLPEERPRRLARPL